MIPEILSKLSPFVLLVAIQDLKIETLAGLRVLVHDGALRGY
jgi:hypothetical protein